MDPGDISSVPSIIGRPRLASFYTHHVQHNAHFPVQQPALLALYENAQLDDVGNDP